MVGSGPEGGSGWWAPGPEAGAPQVTLVCQRCTQPLKLDTSFKILDPVTIQELTAPLPATAQLKPGETQEEEANS